MPILARWERGIGLLGGKRRNERWVRRAVLTDSRPDRLTVIGGAWVGSRGASVRTILGLTV